MYYTLGQRQGLQIGGRKDAGDEPWYVVDKDMQENALVVAQGATELLLSGELTATDASWIGLEPAGLDSDLTCNAKVRYRQADQACTVSREGAELRVRFEQPQRAVAPGQFVVFYQEDRCLGGAVIDRIQL